MKDEEYKKDSYMKAIPEKEYMRESPIKFEHKPTLCDSLIDWMNADHYLSRGKVIVLISAIVWLGAHDFSNFLLNSGVTQFAKNYGGFFVALAGIFILARSNKR